MGEGPDRERGLARTTMDPEAPRAAALASVDSHLHIVVRAAEAVTVVQDEPARGARGAGPESWALGSSIGDS